MRLMVNKQAQVSVNEHLVSTIVLFCPYGSHSRREELAFSPFCEFCNSLNANIGARYSEGEDPDVESVAQKCVWWFFVCLES